MSEKISRGTINSKKNPNTNLIYVKIILKLKIWLYAHENRSVAYLNFIDPNSNDESYMENGIIFLPFIYDKLPLHSKV